MVLIELTAAVVQTCQPAIDACKCICKSLKRKYNHVKNLGKNFRELENKETLLLAREEAVKNRDVANPGRTITDFCGRWLGDVEGKKQIIQDLKTRYTSINNNRSLCGLCPFRSLLNLGKDIVRETEVIDSFTNMINLDQMFSATGPAPPERFVRRHPLELHDVPSLDQYVNEAHEFLKEDGSKRLCIWGLPGVGKTTVMENLHKRVENTPFDIIFYFTMTEKGGAEEEIQKQLEEQLGIQVEERSTTERRARNISKELENKRYILFLDQVTSQIDLNKVGIHDDHQHGKVVFACIDRNVEDRPGSEDIKVKRLPENEAQKLFEKIVGTDIMRNPDINGLTKLIVKECGGMPHMINVIAKSLADQNDLAIWRDTLNRLQVPSMEKTTTLEPYYKAFKLVYDKLDKSKQPCLLYWAIFPVGSEVHRDYIIECWRAEQFFTRLKKLAQTRDRGQTIIDEFEKKNMLTRGTKTSRHYKMFVYFQHVAVQIASSERGNRQLLVQQDEMITEEEWKYAERVSLISHQFLTLPSRPLCSGMLTLLLQEHQSLTTIPDLFFETMQKLRVLDLRGTKIKSLPPSISSLINLRGLYLNDCKDLIKLPPEIKELRSLEIFDLSGTGIPSLPTEIEKLTELKCLRISFKQSTDSNPNHVGAESRVFIPPNTVSKLTNLEELSIGVDYNNTNWNNIAETIVGEVVRLQELTTLRFYFPKVDCLGSFIQRSSSWKKSNANGSQGFRSFSITVGNHETNNAASEFENSECMAEKHLRFYAGEGTPEALLEVLEHAYTFELIGHQNVQNLSEFGINHLERLHMCKIEECNEMESIIDGGVTGVVAFQCLKKLLIINNPKLVRIWKGSMGSQSLSALTTLVLKHCPILKNVFSKDNEMLQQLSQLQHLEVEDCLEMEEIIETASVVQRRTLPKLETIQLLDLPNLLTVFRSAPMEMGWPSLKTILIIRCERLKDLAFTMENATKLESIRCTTDWKNGQQWPSAAVQDRFQNLISV